jgi:glycosyltransferase involved in cell wall biosynthesis
MFNEERRLEQCLKSLQFCDQIIVVDLGSNDRSLEIAQQYATEVIHHSHVPVSEWIIPEIVSTARYSWIIRLDPDEVFPSGLVKELQKTLSDSDNIGKVSLPHQYYFLNKELKYTIWGGIRHIARVYNSERGEFIPYVHNPYVLKEGFGERIIDSEGINPIQHYWIDDLNQLLEKHERYISAEGKARFDAGNRFNWLTFVLNTIKALYSSLIRKKGILGGKDGIYLSFFYAWYIARSMLSLREYQKNQ